MGRTVEVQITCDYNDMFLLFDNIKKSKYLLNPWFVDVKIDDADIENYLKGKTNNVKVECKIFIEFIYYQRGGLSQLTMEEKTNTNTNENK